MAHWNDKPLARRADVGDCRQISNVPMPVKATIRQYNVPSSEAKYSIDSRKVFTYLRQKRQVFLHSFLAKYHTRRRVASAVSAVS